MLLWLLPLLLLLLLLPGLHGDRGGGGGDLALWEEEDGVWGGVRMSSYEKWRWIGASWEEEDGDDDGWWWWWSSCWFGLVNDVIAGNLIGAPNDNDGEGGIVVDVRRRSSGCIIGGDSNKEDRCCCCSSGVWWILGNLSVLKATSLSMSILVISELSPSEIPESLRIDDVKEKESSFVPSVSCVASREYRPSRISVLCTGDHLKAFGLITGTSLEACRGCTIIDENLASLLKIDTQKSLLIYLPGKEDMLSRRHVGSGGDNVLALLLRKTNSI